VAFDAIVLAGGTASRLGGLDKATIEYNGRTFLDRALAAVGGAGIVIVAGPRRETARDVLWVREEPPGSGPAAAIGAALPLVDAELTVVLAVDLPLVTPAHIDRLLIAVGDHDGACFVDDEGRDQPLAAVYASNALRACAARDLRDATIRSLVGELDVARLIDPSASLDCDTVEDVHMIEAMEDHHVR
jgi:molybdopterin-guanine dinucleotide biosynthesis protein A